MSFLEPEEDPMVTLEEALAFIETCDSSPRDVAASGVDEVAFAVSKQSGLGATPGLDDLKLDYATFLTEEHAQGKQEKPMKDLAATATTKKVRRREPGSSTRLQRRKKAEILSLREQAQQLESQLEILKRARRSRYPYGQSTVSNLPPHSQGKHMNVLPRKSGGQLIWSSVAALQYEERLKSEKTNRELKVILANQRKVHDSMRALLQKPNTFDGLDYLLRLHSPQPVRASVPDADVAMAQLRQRVQNLYLDADSVCPSEELPSISSQMVVKPHHQHGKVIELSTTTPLSCPLRTAADILWRHFVSAQELELQKNAVEKNCIMSLTVASGTLGMKKLHIIRKYEETDRIVLVWSAFLLHQEQGLQFQDQAWIVVKRSVTNPLGGCVVQTRLRIFPETPAGGSSGQSMGLSKAQDAALDALGEKFRKYMQQIQNKMVEQSDELCMPTAIAS